MALSEALINLFLTMTFLKKLHKTFGSWSSPKVQNFLFGGFNEWEMSVYFGPLFVLFQTLLTLLTNSALGVINWFDFLLLWVLNWFELILIKESPTFIGWSTSQFLLFCSEQTIKYEPRQTIKSDRREGGGDKKIELGHSIKKHPKCGHTFHP